MTEQTAPPKKGKSFVPYTQAEVGYTQVSSNLGQACQNCRWFRSYECSIVRDYDPKSIVPIGWCNKWDAEPAAMPLNAMAVVVVDEGQVTGSGIVLIERSGDTDEKGGTFTPEGEGEFYRAPPSNIIVRGKTEPAPQQQVMLKDATGRRYMFIITSNGYQDREDEWVPSAELKNYVDTGWVADDVFHVDNPLLFWHDDAMKAGEIVWADMQGSFLLELAREGDGPIAKALWDYREANPLGELWGASHRFRYKERTGGVYKGVRKEETTFLPLWAAANLLTTSEVMTVSKSRDDYANQLFANFGVPNAAELLRTGPRLLEEALTKAGVVGKSADGSAALPIFSKEAASLIADMIDAQSKMWERLDSIETASKAAPVVPKEVSDQLGALTAAVGKIMKALEIDPTQASADPATAVDPQTGVGKEAADALQQRQAGGGYDPFFGDMKVKLPGAQL